MADDTNALLNRICGVIAERTAAAKARQSAVMAGREAGYLPMWFARPDALAGDDWPLFDWFEQWHDPAKSLYMQLRDMAGDVASGSDVVPTVRADTGVINCMTVFGAAHTVPAHTKPVISEYVRLTGETLEDYFRRVLSPYDARRGLVFLGPALRDGEHDRAMDAWHRAQDERFG